MDLWLQWDRCYRALEKAERAYQRASDPAWSDDERKHGYAEREYARARRMALSYEKLLVARLKYQEFQAMRHGIEFRKFHAENPHVYDLLAEIARQTRKAGHERCGIGMLWEVLRWRVYLETTDMEFKLNNNYRAHYARLLMACEPDLSGMFETRGG